MADDREPVVLVRVLVNVDNLRRGEEGEVELTPRIQKLISSGYLQILGHVWEPAPPAPVANPARVRAPARKGGDGGGEGDDQG